MEKDTYDTYIVHTFHLPIFHIYFPAFDLYSESFSY